MSVLSLITLSAIAMTETLVCSSRELPEASDWWFRCGEGHGVGALACFEGLPPCVRHLFESRCKEGLCSRKHEHRFRTMKISQLRRTLARKFDCNPSVPTLGIRIIRALTNGRRHTQRHSTARSAFGGPLF